MDTPYPDPSPASGRGEPGASSFHVLQEGRQHCFNALCLAGWGDRCRIYDPLPLVVEDGRKAGRGFPLSNRNSACGLKADVFQLTDN